jgi:hypothetical protein
MDNPDYDDPAVEQRWCNEQRDLVAAHLRSHHVKHGRIREWPAWHLAPYVSLWAIEKVGRRGSIGWWAICGDVPPDYVSSADVEPPQDPRSAMRVIVERWRQLVKLWKTGRHYKDIQITGLPPPKELARPLEKRVKLLMEWIDDDSLWEEENEEEEEEEEEEEQE